VLGNEDAGDSIDAAQLLVTSAPIPGIIECDSPINSGPQHHYVVMAGVNALTAWVRDGTDPPVGPQLAVEGEPAAYVKDPVGNTVGGIRSPWVDAPTAILSGDGQTGICFLFGRTEILDAPTIASLYVDQGDYTTQALDSLDAAVAAGFILLDDEAIIEEAIEARATELGLDGDAP
jgi:hypothetical protein